MQKIKSLKWLMMATLFMFSALTTFTMTSCSDDDDDDAESVVGAWKEDATEGSYKSYLLFNTDGTAYSVEVEDNYSGAYPLKWKQSGNKVTIIDEEDGETYESEGVISGNKLTITDEEDGEKYEVVYTRTSEDVAKIIADILAEE